MASNSARQPARLLVVDDEPDLRTLYALSLLREGHHVDTAGDLSSALELLASTQFDVLVTDMRLPDGSGLDLLHHVRRAQRAERCVVITAYGSAENAVESLKAGAFDYLTKPVDLKQFRSVIASAVEGWGNGRPAHAACAEMSERNAAAGTAALQRIVGESAAMQRVKSLISKVAPSMAPVLILGESGTGKELVAQALHASSHRAQRPLIAVNCSAIPENLLETEFFGVKKGAYTGATQDRDGFFQAARTGTLFLDEIGDLPIAMQAKLLRAIQERRIRPVGCAQEEPADVRIISATHKDLGAEVQAGRFRQDLYYRLNVIELSIPPLRERREDLPALCHTLLEHIAQESGIDAPSLTPEALSQLMDRPLKGNVRELENLLHRAVALFDGVALRFDPDALPNMQTDASTRAGEATLPENLQSHLDEQEREIILQTLQNTGFNRTVAAAKLGLSLRQIRYRMARLGIDAPANADEPDAAV